MTCEEIEELAGAIALGAVPEDEWPAIREHLATCTRGHPEVEQLLPVAELLLVAVPVMEPPARLRERILAAARADLGVFAEPLAPAPPVPTEDGAPAPPSVVMRTDRAWWQRAGWGWGAAAAMLILTLGLATWNIALQRDLDRTEDQATTAERALALVVGGEAVVRVNSTLAGASGVLVQPRDGSPTLLLQGLPQPNQQTYQVWALRGGQPTSLGVFQPDESGRRVVTLPIDLANVDAVAVTLEPLPNGSPLPTSMPILVAAVRG
jgi:Anti-sigma-K factor rskA, C-terminal